MLNDAKHSGSEFDFSCEGIVCSQATLQNWFLLENFLLFFLLLGKFRIARLFFQPIFFSCSFIQGLMKFMHIFVDIN